MCDSGNTESNERCLWNFGFAGFFCSNIWKIRQKLPELLKIFSVIIPGYKVRGTAAAVAEDTLVSETGCVSAKTLLKVIGLTEGADMNGLTIAVVYLAMLLVIWQFIRVSCLKTGSNVI